MEAGGPKRSDIKAKREEKEERLLSGFYEETLSKW